MSQKVQSEGKERAEAEQTLLMEIYEDYRETITRKGNNAAINKVREVAWQNITDRLNVEVTQRIIQYFSIKSCFINPKGQNECR